MDKLSIGKVVIEDLELIDSRVINLFNNIVDICVENIIFRFEFVEDKNEKGAAVIDKVADNAFHVKIYNVHTGGLRGMIRPVEFGVIDNVSYCFSMTGLHYDYGKYMSVIFNLFQEVKNETN